MTSTRDPVWHAGRLVQWGLRPLARPAQEADYRDLVERYFDDGAFRTTVRELADGLGLHVLDVSEHGVVLAPHDDSIFALKPADFRGGSSKVDDRLLDGLAQVAIAATVFPRAGDLDEDPDISVPLSPWMRSKHSSDGCVSSCPKRLAVALIRMPRMSALA